MKPSEFQLPLDVLKRWESTAPERIYLRQPIDGQWRDFTWKQAGDEVRRIAAFLKAQNFPPGSHIAIFSKNCAHWILADYAIWMAGHVSVPIYPNLTAATIRKILEHSESKLLFVGKLDKWAEQKAGVPAGLPMVAFPYGVDDTLPQWEAITAQYEPLTGETPRRWDECATIVYTSGTTGEPKGVMHRFLSFGMSGTRICQTMGFDHQHVFFSYLPMAHVAERLLTETLPLYCGSMVCFAESLETFGQNLREVAPTVFLGVPRIWMKFQEGVWEKLPEKKLRRLLRLPLISTLVRRKLKAGLGLHRARFCITGAAPTPVSLMEWYRNIGIEIREGYGMTENFSYSHLNFGGVQVGAVGQPWPDVETKISDDGEILVKSDCTMTGYYKAKHLTNEVLRNGYLYTGDQGEIGSGGFLKITGRVKDLFKTAKGKYVAPGPIELKFSGHAFVEQVCLVGAGLTRPMAVVALSAGARKQPREVVDKELKRFMREVNGALDQHERLGKVVIIDDAWTIENNMLTATLKVRRAAVEKFYQERIPAWESGNEEVLRTNP